MKGSIVHGLGLVTAMALIAAGGVVHGLMIDRWDVGDATVGMAKQLNIMPDTVGSWRMTTDEPLDEHTLQTLECFGHIARTYVDDTTGATVKVAVLLGPHGPISVHTPEICYSSRDYSIEKPREAVEISSADGAKDYVWGLTLRSRNLDAQRLRVYYAWTADGKWQASANPRFTYARQPFLLKLQIAGPVSPVSDASNDPSLRFLKDFTPQIRRQLFDASNR